LAVEEQFYLLLPFVVAFVSRQTLIVIALACVVTAPLVRAAFAINWNWWAAYTLLPARMENLMCGALVACLLRSERGFGLAMRYRTLIGVVLATLIVIVATQLNFTISPKLSQTAPFLSVCLSWFQYTLLSFMFSLALLRIFLHRGGRFNAVLRSPILVGTGMIPYGIYMYHQAINGLLQGIILGQQPSFSTWADVGVAGLSVCIVLLAATAFYILIEKPSRGLGQKVRYQKEPIPSGKARHDAV
jgi:peptidoglycan/LPS O-acetylase OafA/YrhL